ncbi:MAG: glycosyltransferase family 4 protein [Rhodoferax sp.]|nr:glycosyltransferase family 4 protein [Rhodoferax sp.]
MRVAMLALHFAEYTLRLSRALREQRREVLFVTYADHAANELGRDWEAGARSAGLRILVLERPRHPGQVLRNVWRLRSALTAFAPDVIHSQETLRDELLLTLFSLPRCPFVLTVHDPAPHPGADSVNMGARRLRYRNWLRGRARLAIVHGEALRAALERESPHLAGRIRIARHGPLGGPLQPAPSTGGLLRLLFFGRVEAYKGLGCLVDAVRAVVNSGLRVEVVVAGRGSDLARHRAAMAETGCFVVHDRYIPADGVANLFGECGVVVLPYVEGSQSGVAAMALGFGRAVLATRVGAIPDLVRHGVNGILVPPADVAALAAAISQLAQDPALLLRLGKGARELCDGELSWDAIGQQTCIVHEEASEPTELQR